MWLDNATMQKDVLLHFYTEMRPKHEEIILLSRSIAFFVVYLHLWKPLRLPGKSYKLQQKEKRLLQKMQILPEFILHNATIIAL